MRNLLWTLALGLVACSTPSGVTPISVPLQYKLQASPGEFTAAPPCAEVADVVVSDARTEKSLGKRFVEGRNAASAPVTASNDVAAWVRAGALDALKRAGAGTSKSVAPTLTISIDQITTSENVLHRSGYEGRIVFTAELQRAGSVCWKDRVDGFSENYGYSGSVENYQETLNHALDRAMIHLLANPDFRKAACSCGGA